MLYHHRHVRPSDYHHQQRPPPRVEGDALDLPDHHSARSREGRGHPGRAGSPPLTPAPRVEGDAMDAPGSPPPAPHDAGEWDALNVPGSAPHARHVRKKGGHHGRAGITTRGRSRGRMGRARISTAPPPPWRKGKGWRCAGSPQRQHGTGTPSGPLLPPVLIYLFVFPSALLALASEHKKAAHQGRPYPY